MGSIIYHILLAIFIFASVTAYINESGLYSMNLPTSRASVQLNEVQKLNEGLSEETMNPGISMINQLSVFGKSIWAGFIALFSLGPMLESYGIPAGMAGMLISPIGFVAIFWLFEVWLGRPAE